MRSFSNDFYSVTVFWELSVGFLRSSKAGTCRRHPTRWQGALAHRRHEAMLGLCNWGEREQGQEDRVFVFAEVSRSKTQGRFKLGMKMQTLKWARTVVINYKHFQNWMGGFCWVFTSMFFNIRFSDSLPVSEELGNFFFSGAAPLQPSSTNWHEVAVNSLQQEADTVSELQNY